eukprot:3167467-Rhodomonas_salina.3
MIRTVVVHCPPTLPLSTIPQDRTVSCTIPLPRTVREYHNTDDYTVPQYHTETCLSTTPLYRTVPQNPYPQNPYRTTPQHRAIVPFLWTILFQYHAYVRYHASVPHESALTWRDVNSDHSLPPPRAAAIPCLSTAPRTRPA